MSNGHVHQLLPIIPMSLQLQPRRRSKMCFHDEDGLMEVRGGCFQELLWFMFLKEVILLSCL